MTGRSVPEWIGPTRRAKTRLEWIISNAAQHGAECMRGPFSGNWYHAVKVGPGKYNKAHRLMCEAAHGPPPSGAVVMHSCNNKWCVNPTHLSWGTQKENITDAVLRGLLPIGERATHAKLTEDMVREARKDRANGMTFRLLEKKYGISKGSMWHAVNGTQWKHVK